ncbi:MAG TPA: glycerophosphodiester phosphodiesterase [Terriglobales bacterium]
MSRPLLLGHRGLRLPGEPPENTPAAFDRALELGCDGFEFDVRCTKDEQAVLCHDAQYAGRELAAVSHAQVPQLALLDEVLARYSGRAFLDIELKVPGLEARILGALKQHRPHHGFVISSFHPKILQKLHALDDGIPLGFIFDRESALTHWRELPGEYVIPHFPLLKRELLNQLHKSGKKAMVWTVNNVEDIRRFRDWGVNGIVSDDPGLLMKTVSRT